MSEIRRPYLLPTGTPQELALIPGEAALGDIRNLLSLCIASERLWFRVEYTDPDGERCGVSPVDFINARHDQSLRNELLEGTSRKLLWGENIVITILNPRQIEKGHR